MQTIYRAKTELEEIGIKIKHDFSIASGRANNDHGTPIFALEHEDMNNAESSAFAAKGDARLFCFLSNASQSRKMHAGGMMSHSDFRFVQLLDIVGTGFCWSSMSEVSLSIFQCFEGDLVGFLLLHADTLEHCSLSKIIMIEGEWHKLFERIAGKFPKLKGAHFDDVLNSLSTTAYTVDMWDMFKVYVANIGEYIVVGPDAH